MVLHLFFLSCYQVFRGNNQNSFIIHLLSDKNSCQFFSGCLYICFALSLCERAFGSWSESGNLIHNRWIGTQLGFGTAVQNIQSFMWRQATHMVTSFFFLLSFHVCQFIVQSQWRTANSTVLLLYWKMYNNRKHINPRQQIHFDSFHWWT